jgi:hypothetical protein
MLELAILTGRRAQTVIPLPVLPRSIGRSGADIDLESSGVASRHAVLEDRGPEGFQIQAVGEATIYSGGKSYRSLRIKNGDVFELGGVGLQFRLCPARPRNLDWLEISAASLILLIGAGELLWLFISASWP